MRRDICILCGCVFTSEFFDGSGGGNRSELFFASTQKMALSDIDSSAIIGTWSGTVIGGKELSGLLCFGALCAEYLYGRGVLWQMQ